MRTAPAVGSQGPSETPVRQVISRVPAPKAKAKAQNGVLVRLSSHVQDFDDRLDAKGVQLQDLVLRSLGREVGGRTKSEKSIQVSDSEESRGRPARRPPRPSPSPSDSVSAQEIRRSDTILHLRNFLESGNWNCCVLEHYGAEAAMGRRERISFARHAAWQRLRSACSLQEVTARGWVCGHNEKYGTIVRLIAVEVPQSEGDDKPGPSGESPLPLLPPTEGEGLQALLEKQDASVSSALALGTPVRVRFLNDTPMQRRTLREVGASCRVTLESRDREDERLRVVGVLGPGREEEWPEGGIAEVLRCDPCQSAAAAQARSSLGPPALEQAHQLGIEELHGSLVPDAAPVQGGRASRLSRVQSRCWADQRVRDGLGRARQGDQKAAIERYDAALELCPQHKEGLVGRGRLKCRV